LSFLSNINTLLQCTLRVFMLESPLNMKMESAVQNHTDNYCAIL